MWKAIIQKRRKFSDELPCEESYAALAAMQGGTAATLPPSLDALRALSLNFYCEKNVIHSIVFMKRAYQTHSLWPLNKVNLHDNFAEFTKRRDPHHGFWISKDFVLSTKKGPLESQHVLVKIFH
ncbi:unnamed protein product [Leptosia nina]|uniref:Uncharacterized protein n=1 Tax=Leptosia nina TaxID=320188 RepID=A0AAV1JFD7_9NEOP